MGRFDALKTTIDANIRENGNQEITGEILNLVLNEMVSVVDDEKQDLLMDGVNIKTINGQKILGRGNITIEGGEGGGGGITEEKEVYIGSEEPPVGAKVWIDPTGTPSSPSQPSAGVEVIDNLESESSTAALSANQGRVLKEMIGQGGGGGTKIYVVPEGVMNATMDAPYTLTSEESEEFLSHGNFANTIVAVKFNVEGTAMMSYVYAREVLGLRTEMGTGMQTSVEKRLYHTDGSALINIQITHYVVTIGDLLGSGEIVGVAMVSSGKINL